MVSLRAKRSNLFVLIFLLLAFAVYFAQAQEKAKIKVAVLPPSASGDASASVSQGLTSVIVTELSRSPSLEVSDRRDVEKALKEQAFGLSGCTDQHCQIEIGKILQSKWVVTGDLNKIGTLYILTLKILNVETGQTEYQDEEQHTGAVEGLVDKTKTLTARLRNFLEGGKTVGTTPEETPLTPTAKQKEYGTLSITTTPPGATVILGAENVGRTPVTLKVHAGKQELTLSLTGYEDIPKVVTIEKDKTTEITEEFRLQTGTLSVNSTPIGASVYLDGAYKGVTPLELKNVSMGTHTVKVSLENYAEALKSVDVKYKDAANLNFNLSPLPGKLAVTSTPQGAKVTVDGKNAGETPVYGYEISAGSHKVSVSLSGYKTQTETVEILANQPKTLNVSLEPGATVVPSVSGGDMVLIPAGEFLMGSDESEAKDAWESCKTYWKDCPWDLFKAEMPKHKVVLDAYSIDKYPVTNAQYKKCVNAGKCKKPHDTTWYDDKNMANHPVVYVDWNQASAFCTWAGKRLPTEAEWEKAARGENGNVYPWGNEWDCTKSCNSVSPCKQNSTCAVGSYSEDVSSYGVYDMAGNVWEWVSDWYDKNYYQNSPGNNPKGPDNGQYRVLRGGSWRNLDPSNFRGAYRHLFPATGAPQPRVSLCVRRRLNLHLAFLHLYTLRSARNFFLFHGFFM